MKNKRERLAEIFEDTIRQCETNRKIQTSILNSVNKQCVILEEEKINNLLEENKYQENTKMIVSKKRSLEAAGSYKDKKVCVLNFASAKNAGGGVARGASAQEEAICRCSTLYPCLTQNEVYDKYHGRHREMAKKGELDQLYNDDCIYTPDVLVIKSDTDYPETLPEEKWYVVDVISCSAPNLKKSGPNQTFKNGKTKISNLELKEIHAKRMARILDVAKSKGAQVLILGAFGCGAFENDPYPVVEGMYEAIKSRKRDFELIEFAVYCTPKDQRNFTVFHDYLNSNKARNFF